MQLKIKKQDLVSALDMVSNVVKDNKIRPVLSQVLITADEKIKITATDLEQTIIVCVPGEILESGKTTFDVKEGLDLLKLSEIAEVDIKTEGNQLVISGMTFVTHDTDEFPEISIEESESYTLNGKEFIEKLKKVSMAASQDPSNIEIRCVKVGSNMMAATDSYRMCIDKNNIGFDGISIPIESVNNLIKIIPLDDFDISVTGSKMCIKSDRIVYFSRLIDLPFVDVKSIMEGIKTDKKAVIDSISLQKLMKKMILVSKNSAESRNAAVFIFKSGSLELRAKNDKVKIKEKLKIHFSGEEVKVSLNCKFVLDFISNIKNMVEFNFSNSNSAFVLHEEGKEEYKYLTMPLALKE